jgi:large conductance mechanosensitive channel
MSSFFREFKAFIARGNVLDLAVGVVIGIAFTAVITSMVDDVLSPIIGAIVGEPSFDDLTFELGNGVVRYGAFLTAVLDFVIVAFALFLVVKAFNAFRRQEEEAPELSEKDVLVQIRDLIAPPGSAREERTR